MASNNPFMAPPDGATPNLEGLQLTQTLPDGSAIFELINDIPSKRKIKKEVDFYENLAEDTDKTKLESLVQRLLERIKEDKDSRSDWEATITLAMKYLGFKIEEFMNVPFLRACAAYDTTLATALVRIYSTARAELFPAAGPAKSEIIGTPTEKTEDQGDRVKMFMNLYLTQIDNDYYPDSERLLMYVCFFGCAFRKVYQDPVLNRPVARLVKPQDFIVNNNTTSLLSSTRLTEVMYLTKKEVMIRQRSGDFIKYDLDDKIDDADGSENSVNKKIKQLEGIKTTENENKSLFKFYECHTDLSKSDIEESLKDKSTKRKDIPRPYIVTICDTTKKIVAIKRNWKEEDTENFKRLECYVHYYYMPSFGLYGLGLAHLMGSNSIVLTSILRQQIDAGSLKNFPGGLMRSDMRLEKNEIVVGPATFQPIETGGAPIGECVMLMPYAEPSQTLTGLRMEVRQEAIELAGASQADIPEGGTNAPVGTTLALLEQNSKVQSSVLRSLHNSLGYELKLLYNLFGEYLEDEPYPFGVPGQETSVMKADFNDRVNIVPVSDPNVLTSTHRLIRDESLLRTAQSNPEIHDMREVYRRFYASMKVENIDKIMPKPEEPQPMDPVTENNYLMLNKPIVVAKFQDDDAHNIVHRKFIQDNATNPMLVANMLLHIQKHEANKIIKGMEQNNPFFAQQIQGQEGQEHLLPEVQNALAKQDAQHAIDDMEAQQKQQAEDASKQVDPVAAMMADVEQHREAALLKNEETKLKAETESFKAQLKFESEKEKTESQLIIAEQKAELERLKAQLKFESDQAKTQSQLVIADDKNEIDLTIADMNVKASRENKDVQN